MKESVLLSLQAGEPIGAGVIRMSDALLENAIKRIEQPGGDREEEIHAVRTCLKRVRAILRLIRPVIGSAAFRRENMRLRKTAQMLGPMRDAAVGIEALRHLARSAEGDKKRRAFSAVHTRFAKHIAPPDAAVQEKLMRATVRGLEANRSQLRELRIAEADWEMIGTGLEQVYRACRRRMKGALAKGGDDRFHRWRIRVKNLCYEFEFLAPVWPKRLGSMVARLQKLQGKLGEDHDITVLKAALEKAPGHFGDVQTVRRVLGQLEKRSRKLRHACERPAREIFKEKPHRFMRKFERHCAKWREANAPSHSA